jgi:NAD(P)-dependent dehydrogenase (short-subunit alcohol dehydrogenase family)
MSERVVVITGASSGIGAETAKQVGAKGWHPVLAARREPELRAVAERAGSGALVVPADVTRRIEVQRILDAAIAKFGHVDVWINNAGRGISRPVSQLTDQDLDDMLAVNLKSAFYGMQVALAHMKERRRGHIINVSSMLGRVPFAIARSAYSASKHAVNALTANLRMELRESFPDIHVSLVSPGVVATDFGLKALHGGPDSRSLPMAQPVEEVAAVIVEVIERPRADVYTRPGMRERVVEYLGAEDIGAVEAGPPFATPARRD